MISTQLAGGFDVTLGNYVSYIVADAEQHADLRIIAEGSVMQPGNQEIVTPSGSRITTLAGLRGGHARRQRAEKHRHDPDRGGAAGRRSVTA